MTPRDISSLDARPTKDSDNPSIHYREGLTLMHMPALYPSSIHRSFMAATMFTLVIVGMSLTTGCGGTDSGGIDIGSSPGGGGPSSGGGSPASPTTSVSLAWNPVQGHSVYAYFVHYGKHSSGQHGRCNYTFSTYVGYPSATITGLDPNTQYFFAVSAYNGVQSPCSNEVSTVTPPAA